MRNKVVILSILLLGLLLYGLTLRGVAGNPRASDVRGNLDQATKPLELSPERGRFLLTMSLGEDGSFALSPELGEAAAPDVGYYQNRFYVYFAPGISILALPLYLIGRTYGLAQVGAFATVMLFSVANLAFLYIIARHIFKLRIASSLVAPLIYGFASSAWSYATTLYQHQVTTFFILSSFYSVWRYKQGTRYSWIWGVWVWTAYAVAILIDYPNALVMLPVMIYFLISALTFQTKERGTTIRLKWSFLLTSFLFVLVTIWHGYYNYTNFGDWKRVGGSLPGYKDVKEQQEKDSRITSEQAVQSLESEKNPIKFFSEEHFPFGVYTLLFSVDRGLFFYYPIFILSLFGMYYLIRYPSVEVGVLFGVVFFNIFLYASFGDPWGGWAFGPRYMIPASACLALFASFWIAHSRLIIVKELLAIVLFAYSSAVALLGALTTNAVPPKIEGDYLNMGYNFFWNLIYFRDGSSSSFIYNTFYERTMPLDRYYLIIYVALMTLFVVVLFGKYAFTLHHKKLSFFSKEGLRSLRWN